YVLEVYRGRQKAERHFGIFALYVMYFPQLVAGPIERPQNLLHQFHERKHFDLGRLQDGLSLALWGLFKKVVVADSLAIYTDTIYNTSSHYSGASLLVATYCFAFQIYCDFSGYSDIARGVSRVYGIELMKNFDAPYLSKSIREFWHRWHISLSTWFRDYVYIPLGGNRKGHFRKSINILITFVLSGLWHGAGVTFILWGFLHGLYMLVLEFFSKITRSLGGTSWLGWLITIVFVGFAWILFRASSIQNAMDIIQRGFEFGNITGQSLTAISGNSIQYGNFSIAFIFAAIIFMFTAERLTVP